MRPAWVDKEQGMTRRRWADLRDSFPDTPERLAARARAKEQLDQELAEYAAQNHEEVVLWDFLDRGQAAQAAVDEIIANFDGVAKDVTAFDGPMNEELRLRVELAQAAQAAEEEPEEGP